MGHFVQKQNKNKDNEEKCCNPALFFPFHYVCLDISIFHNNPLINHHSHNIHICPFIS